MRSLFIALFVLLTAPSGMGQVVQLQGHIQDARSGEAVPFVSIGARDQPYGTASNENGDFLFRIPSLPVELVFSHVSYRRRVIRVEDASQPINISLEPGEILMPEIVVTERPVDELAYTLVDRARERLVSLENRTRYGKSFYRQVSHNDGDYCELYEIFFDTRYSRSGIREWAIQEGRYALKTAGQASTYIFNKNFTLLFRILSMIQPPTNDLIEPVHPEVRRWYELKINRWIQADDRRIAVIGFVPRPEVDIPAMAGELYVDSDNYDILKMEGEIRNDRLRFITLSEKEGGWKNYVLYFDAAFQPTGTGDLQLNYIAMRHEFDYYLGAEFRHRVTTRGLLTYYDQEQPDRRRRLGGKIQRYSRRDADVLEELGYNREFWEDNPIVKRTPVEEEVIASFESTNSFGSIYLNNRDQVVLEDKALDNEPFMAMLVANLKETRLAPTGEKVYLHRDKPYYMPGETVWFKAYLVNAANHLPTERSGTLYVELLSPEGVIVAESLVELGRGMGASSLDLPFELAAGQYQLRAYTRWMQNFDQAYFYQAALPVYGPLQAVQPKADNAKPTGIDLQFFPEGGYLVAGIPAQVAFKAIGTDGLGRDVQGSVYNSSGAKVGAFQSTHKGMGTFIFPPTAGERYTARIDGSEETYEFPAPEISGFSIMVNNYRPNSVDVLIKTSEDLADSDFYIVGQTRGVIYHRYKGKAINRSARVEIPKAKLPDGIFHIALFDKNQVPHCERLVLINKGYASEIAIRGLERPAQPRERIMMELQVRDQNGKPLPGANISVAALDAGQMRRAEHAENIQAYLLLSSDLRGMVEDPGYYFGDPDNLEKMKALDLVMLTHGWRRFTWREIINSPERKYQFAHENGFTIQGVATLRETGKPASNLYLTLISAGNMPGIVLSTQTDAEGRFMLSNLKVTRDVPFIVKAEDARARVVPIDIRLNPVASASIAYELPAAQPVYSDEVERYVKAERQRKETELSFQQQEDVLLPELEVTAPRPRQEINIYGQPDNVIRLTEKDYVYTDIFQFLQGRVPGLNISGQGMSTRVTIRGATSLLGSNTPLFMLDGVILNSVPASAPAAPMTQPPSNPPPGVPGGGGGQSQPASQAAAPAAAPAGGDDNSIISSLMTIMPSEVDRIEVYKNAGASAAFGMRGANGVIAVFTRKGPAPIEPTTPDMVQISLPGYHLGREFYQPNYFTISREQKAPDIRSVLYWNPWLQADDRGRVRFEFYNSDQARQIQVIAEGISDFGEPLFYQAILGGAPAR